MAGGFDEEEDFEEIVPSLSEEVDPAVLLPPAGDVEEVWDDADFDEEFDEDFDDEPDEDLERFEKELNEENVTPPVVESDFEEDEDF